MCSSWGYDSPIVLRRSRLELSEAGTTEEIKVGLWGEAARFSI